MKFFIILILFLTGCTSSEKCNLEDFKLSKLPIELSDKEKENEKMKSILGTSSRTMLPSIARKKLDKAASDKDEIHEKYKETIANLEDKIQILVDENQNLRSQIAQ